MEANEKPASGVDQAKEVGGKAVDAGKSLFKKLCLYLVPLALKFLADNREEVITELRIEAAKTKRTLDDIAVDGLDKALEFYASREV